MRRIMKISIINLFGSMNYTIPFNMDDRITIIHGPNGYGKTILLSMIDGFCNFDFSIFSKVPFSEFSLEFDNNELVQICKDKDAEGLHVHRGAWGLRARCWRCPDRG